MYHFWSVCYDIIFLEKMKGVFEMKPNKCIKSILALFLVVLLCFSFVGCDSEKEPNNPQTSSTTQNTDSVPQESENQPTQNSTPVVEQPAQEMCWDCGEVPVTGSNIYCANCKCMLCNQRRKIGNYMYCSNHNCNDSGCAAMAVENSQYCVSHKCAMPNCRNKIWSGSQYCATHK